MALSTEACRSPARLPWPQTRASSQQSPSGGIDRCSFPGSPHPGHTAHRQGWRLGYPWQPTTSARSLHLQGHAMAKTQERGTGWGAPRCLPQTEQRQGCLCCVVWNSSFCPGPEPASAPWSSCSSPRELPRGRGSQGGPSCFAYSGDNRASPEWRLYTVSPL